MSFIKTFFLSSFCFLLVCAGLIISVDPYEKLGINFWGFETKAVAQGRENKFQELENTDIKYEAFILGSSAAHRYSTRLLKNLTGLESFNYAVQHTTPDDYLAITRHILSKAKPKLIILQSDFTDLDQSFQTDNRLFNSSLNQFVRGEVKKEKSIFSNTYFTLKALSDSLKVFHVNYFGKASHTYLKHGDYKKEKLTPGPVKIQQSTYPDYKISQEKLNKLLELKKLAKQHNFKLIIFSAPISIEHLNLIQASTVDSKNHQMYLSLISQNFKHFYNFEHESIKNYSNYKNFHNSTHPTKTFSSIILKRIFENSYPELGIKY